MINNEISADEKKMMRKVFWRSFFIIGSWNPARAMGVGFLYALMPVINKFYKNENDRIEAMKRNVEYFNCTSAVSTFPMGVVASLEKENSENADFDASSINAVKASLMGPLSGIGDSIFWGTLRVIAAGIGVSLAEKGSVLGPILFLLLFNIPALFVRYMGTFLGYGLGEKYIKQAYESGVINVITKAAGILGIIMIGGMIVTTVNITTPLTFSLGGTTYQLQAILDDILKGILPLLVTFFTFHLVSKKVSTTKIMLGMVVVGLILGFLGIL
ncbi:MAG: PTS system mannose/fructose/sorbose family transporter subunit IID [Lachnospiraceae bacterium]